MAPRLPSLSSHVHTAPQTLSLRSCSPDSLNCQTLEFLLKMTPARHPQLSKPYSSFPALLLSSFPPLLLLFSLLSFLFSIPPSFQSFFSIFSLLFVSLSLFFHISSSFPTTIFPLSPSCLSTQNPPRFPPSSSSFSLYSTFTCPSPKTPFFTCRTFPLNLQCFLLSPPLPFPLLLFLPRRPATCHHEPQDGPHVKVFRDRNFDVRAQKVESLSSSLSFCIVCGICVEFSCVRNIRKWR